MLASKGSASNRSPSKLIAFFKENIVVPHNLETEIICDNLRSIYEKYSDDQSIGVRDSRMIGFLKRKLAEYHNGQVILFVDELENCGDEVRYWDFGKMDDLVPNNSTTPLNAWMLPEAGPGPKAALILVFNPGTSQVNAMIRHHFDQRGGRGWMGFEIEPLMKHEWVPKTFFKKHLTLRYRNSLNIQKFTKFLMDSMGAGTGEIHMGPLMGPETGEIHMGPLLGDLPFWIDIGCYTKEKLDVVEYFIDLGYNATSKISFYNT